MSFIKQYVHGEISSSEYWAQVKAELDFSTSCMYCEKLEIFIIEILDKAFQDLDKLDRNDPFWAGTNLIPTIYKIPQYAEFLFERNETLVFASYVMIFYRLIYWQNFLEVKYWQVLKEHNQINYAWLVNTTYNMSVYCCDSYVNSFVDLVFALKIKQEVEIAISQLEEASNYTDLVCEWGSNVRERLN